VFTYNCNVTISDTQQIWQTKNGQITPLTFYVKYIHTQAQKMTFENLRTFQNLNMNIKNNIMEMFI
jgi:hypothetical protein